MKLVFKAAEVVLYCKQRKRIKTGELMNIILTAVNAKYIHSNLAVYSLRSYAKPYLDEVEIAEYTINQTVDFILMDLYKRKPDILCFSCYIWNIEYVKEIIAEIHKLLPQMPIWLGGPEVSYDAVQFLELYPQVTGIMKGEGEETFLEVLDYYHEKKKDLSAVAGLTYREGSQIKENPWRSVMDLSKVPFVYQDIDTFVNKIIYYESSRGCPFSCSYCLSSVDKCLRFRNLALVKKELQFFLDHKIPQVKFVDRTFNCNQKHAMAIWSYIYEHDNGVTNFHFEVAADILTEEEISLLQKMRPGLVQLEIGVQSTNPNTITEIHRKMDFKKVARIVQQINSGENVHQHLDLIAGLPHEGLDSFQKSFDEVYAVRPEQLQLGFLKVLKGSYMSEHQEEYGLIHKEKPPYEVLSTKWLSYDDILVLKYVEEMVETFYNSGQFSNTIEYLESYFSSAFEMYDQMGRFYEKQGYHKRSHSRIGRYEILLEFIKTAVPKKSLDFFQELLTFDLYLRENVKNRPDFAGDYTVKKEELFHLYDEVFPKEEKLASYAGKHQRKMIHIEKFRYDILSGRQEEKETLILLDYQKRNPLNYQAKVIRLPLEEE